MTEPSADALKPPEPPAAEPTTETPEAQPAGEPVATEQLAEEMFALALAEPFHPSEIQWRPIAFPKTRRDRALVVPFYDVRLVYDRLDAVVGPGNWQIRLAVIPAGGVYTEIGIRIGGEWVWKGDLGMVGRDDDDTEAPTKLKGDASDGAKRAAALWGIGRCYWMIPKDDNSWVDYDEQNRKILSTPSLPVFCLPYAMRAERNKKPSKPAPKPKPTPTQAASPDVAPAEAPPPYPAGRPYAPETVRSKLDALYKRLKETPAGPVDRTTRNQLEMLIRTAFKPAESTEAMQSVLMYFFAEKSTKNLNEHHCNALWRYLDAHQDGSKWVLPPYVADELRSIRDVRASQGLS